MCILYHGLTQIAGLQDCLVYHATEYSSLKGWQPDRQRSPVSNLLVKADINRQKRNKTVKKERKGDYFSRRKSPVFRIQSLKTIEFKDY
ncbi:hypothetical protein CEXT_155351 [Caerostris extrusa]|uniref:Uncharacterized protein n=1 Tax=Caerostris extrusa TaxID=172846 RepID=A0AAV4P793_CAEEX|nr:hypothetical protein CEXT_155351 [Caerostris extrusa]